MSDLMILDITNPPHYKYMYGTSMYNVEIKIAKIGKFSVHKQAME